jgi:uncharacterized protein YdhG (YjbR/CyaY superfamily)
MKKEANRELIPGGVDEYIAECPQDVRAKLEQVRSAIRDVAPDAVETVSYFQMPGYAYEGYDYSGMFVWFSFKEPFIRLHIRPPVIKDHAVELAQYKRSTGILSFPKDEQIHTELIKQLVKASIAVMKGR